MGFETLSENNEGIDIAERYSALLGKERDVPPFSRLKLALIQGGKNSAKVYCWNESDKYRGEDDLIAFIEREIFDAGESGVANETPWNMTRRRKAAAAGEI